MSDKDSREGEAHFKPLEERMMQAGLDRMVITTFRHYYYQLLSGGAGRINRSQIGPVEKVPDLEQLEDYSQAGHTAIKRLL